MVPSFWYILREFIIRLSNISAIFHITRTYGKAKCIQSNFSSSAVQDINGGLGWLGCAVRDKSSHKRWLVEQCACAPNENEK